MEFELSGWLDAKRARNQALEFAGEVGLARVKGAGRASLGLECQKRDRVLSEHARDRAAALAYLSWINLDGAAAIHTGFSDLEWDVMARAEVSPELAVESSSRPALACSGNQSSPQSWPSLA